MALAILSSVLLSSTVIATRASTLGQVAAERTRLAGEAQEHVESMHGFRDNHTWAEFLDGQTSPSYQGVLSARSSIGCRVTSPCMHMGLNPASHLPLGGGVAGSVPASYIEIAIDPDPASTPPQFVDVTVSYGFDNRGGGGAKYRAYQDAVY